MMSSAKICVTVPATTANLGPGFDCLGAALTLYNRFTFVPLTTPAPPLVMTLTGAEADRLSTGPDNLLYQSFLRVYQEIGQTPPPVQIAVEMAVPLARGLGSSATAIVGGLVAANALAGEPLSVTAIRDLAIAIEGHPDNVVPALLGGCQLAVQTEHGNEWVICELPWHQTITPVLAIPNFELSTQAARQVLPEHYSRTDAIFNAAHLGLLVQALATGERTWLQTALADRIHQPYRQALIPGYDAVRTAALTAGADGLVISGAGPTLLALTSPDQASGVAAAMVTAWQELGIQATALPLAIAQLGTQVHCEPTASP
ncbi:homoserine kinase [Trichothermofontia sichuanensis B231]|uniref:homoserine kinase n=1 Tax=Trichothermofontia sichuanensis TaxID=3045816 RepID=UPI002246A93C|nr:homoserine kinase [Trichothermofontia sichuanensis]UZQ53890.1 homoserine kinase [Trichothermofontia sichuanensis B231]